MSPRRRLHLQTERLYRQSGTDTNIIGAQVTGNQVIANVGINPSTGEVGTGNLNIQSLQDTNQYKDKQQSVGGVLSACPLRVCD